MEDFDVVIRETRQMIVPVSSDSMADAQRIVEQDYKRSKYPLDASHLLDVQFTTLYPYYKKKL